MTQPIEQTTEPTRAEDERGMTHLWEPGTDGNNYLLCVGTYTRQWWPIEGRYRIIADVTCRHCRAEQLRRDRA